MRQGTSCTSVSPLSRAPSLRLRGLENPRGENNCFLNVTLQAFWNLRSFRILCQQGTEHQHPAPSLSASRSAVSRTRRDEPLSPEAPLPLFSMRVQTSLGSGSSKKPANGKSVQREVPNFDAVFSSTLRTWIDRENEARKSVPRATGEKPAPRPSPFSVSAPVEARVEGHLATSPLHVPAASSCVYCAIKNLFANYEFGNCEVLPAAAVRTALATCWASTRFKPGDMEDADETLVGVLDALHAWHQGLIAPPPSAYVSCAPSSRDAGGLFSGCEDLSNPLNFLAFYRDIPCNPPCLAHRLFALHVLFLPRCTACGATGEPLVQQLYVHRAYMAELLPLLAWKSSSSGSGNVSCARASTRPPESRSLPRPSSYADASGFPPRNPGNAVQSARKAVFDVKHGSRPGNAPEAQASGECTDRVDKPFRPSSGRGVLASSMRSLFLSDSTFANRESICIRNIFSDVKNAQAERSDSTSLPSEREAVSAEGTIRDGRRHCPVEDAEDAEDRFRCVDAFGYRDASEAAPLDHKARMLRRRSSECFDTTFADSDSVEDEFKRLHQFFQHASVVRFSPKSKAKKKEVAARGGDRSQRAGRARGQRQQEGSDSSAVMRRANVESTKEQRGDCEQCGGAQTVVLDRHCMHAPAIFVCSLTWLPDLAQLAPLFPGVPAVPSFASSASSVPCLSSSSEASFERLEPGSSNGAKQMKSESDEVRRSIFLLLQSLEPVLDVREIFSSNSQGTQISFAAGHRRETLSPESAERPERDRRCRRPLEVASTSPVSRREHARKGDDSGSAVRQEVEIFTADMEGKHVFRGMVCFYGQHYVCFFHHWASAKWVLFDDSRVKRGLMWKDVVSMCVAGKLLPCLLFFERISLRRANRRIRLSCSSSALSPVANSLSAAPRHGVREEFLACQTSGDSILETSEDSSEESASFLCGRTHGIGDGELWREKHDEYGKEALQLFCAEMLSCQNLLLEESSVSEAKKAAVAVASEARSVGDSAIGAAPCRIA
ncbi:ubiquitin carboxyl-terminal hydrolase [Toxoplasma gondii TgCatPRC2]|uniref:Ubiquitin carboxyl-terminal hydrolase n=1 Tax=Toxoplasma gondii TgCatPRC2 TaxID=1130821 RepID=A0A151HFL0_TOXGO|nr:ubiquitin carboxyl-terminal hydrolase [Toxoplasma gondii TgCatPRC2]